MAHQGLDEWGVAELPHDSQVSVPLLRCVECKRRWHDPVERWRVYFTSDNPPETATYCPACAVREFDD